MNQQETVQPANPGSKKVRKEIGEKLAGALADYKQELGEKKLATRVKKVSKLISRDLLKIREKQKRNGKKTAAAAKPAKPAKTAKPAKIKKKKDRIKRSLFGVRSLFYFLSYPPFWPV